MDNPYRLFDAFGFRNFPRHLVKAEKFDRLQILLLDIFWIQTKLEFTDIASVIDDFDLLLSFEFPEYVIYQKIRRALSLSTHILQSDKSQLRSQLQGRLCDQKIDEIKTFLQSFSLLSNPWIKPLNRCLISPDSELVKTIETLSGPIFKISITPNGKYIVCPIDNGQVIRVWDSETGLARNDVLGDFSFFSVAARGNEQVIASLAGKRDPTEKGAIVVYDIQSGRELRRFLGHSNIIQSLLVTQDTQKCISSDLDGKVKVWNLDDCKEIFSLSTASWVQMVGLTPDNSFLLVPYNNIIRIFGIESGEEIASLVGHEKSILSMAVTRNNKLVISSAEKEVKFWDFKLHKELASYSDVHHGRVTSVLITQDDKYAISNSDDWSTVFWNLETLQPQYRLSGHGGNIYSACLSPDGKYMICGYENGSITIWDMDKILRKPSNNSQEYRSGQVAATSSMVISNTGKKIFSSDGDRADIRLWDVETATMEKVLNIHSQGVIQNMLLFPDQKHMAVDIRLDRHGNNILEIWDINRWYKKLEQKFGKLISIAPDAFRVVTSDGLWDVKQNQITPWNAKLLQCSNDGGLLVIQLGTQMGIINLAENRVILELTMTTDIPPTVTIAPDNKSILFLHQTKTESLIEKISIVEKKLLWKRSFPFSRIGSIQFTPNQQHILFSHRIEIKNNGQAPLNETVCIDYSNGSDSGLGNYPYSLICIVQDNLILVSQRRMWDKNIALVHLNTGKIVASFCPDTSIAFPVLLGAQNTLITGEAGRVGELFFLQIENA